MKSYLVGGGFGKNAWIRKWPKLDKSRSMEVVSEVWHENCLQKLGFSRWPLHVLTLVCAGKGTQSGPSRDISKCSAEMHRGARSNSPYSGKGPRWTLLDCDLVI